MDLAGLRGGGDTGDGSNAGGSQRDEEIHDGISKGSKVVTERRRDIGSGDKIVRNTPEVCDAFTNVRWTLINLPTWRPVNFDGPKNSLASNRLTIRLFL
uniref:Uncharacterized protein n=1 Tax=Vespula pensylvanica TaxID=30213 RepID=A0A834P777_VESPE|nr:hypothetical protein H0235_004286 [Vespula pensylvanica]